jgi:hypothetical protein
MRTRARIAQNPATPLFEAVTRPHRLVTELDAHGAIDRHATMCLKNAIAEMVVVDLRDLVSIDTRALALRHYAIAAAFNESGLGEQLRLA